MTSILVLLFREVTYDSSYSTRPLLSSINDTLISEFGFDSILLFIIYSFNKVNVYPRIRVSTAVTVVVGPAVNNNNNFRSHSDDKCRLEMLIVREAVQSHGHQIVAFLADQVAFNMLFLLVVCAFSCSHWEASSLHFSSVLQKSFFTENYFTQRLGELYFQDAACEQALQTHPHPPGMKHTYFVNNSHSRMELNTVRLWQIKYWFLHDIVWARNIINFSSLSQPRLAHKFANSWSDNQIAPSKWQSDGR